MRGQLPSQVEMLGNFETYSDAVVPESDIMLVPLESHMSLLGSRNDFVEIADDMVGFRFGNTDNLSDETWIEEERLPSRDRVGADERMLGDYCLATDRATQLTSTFGLHLSGVKGGKALQILLHWLGKSIIGSILRGPKGVTTATPRRPSEHLQRGIGWRLNLIGDLGLLDRCV